MRFLALFAVLALMGCKTILNPTPLPAGYTYHQDTYKSPTGPEARDIGYDYAYAKNEIVQQKWLETTRDLVTYMEQQTGLTPQTIHVKDALPTTAFNQTFDHTLRHALREKGYTLASGADNYSARLVYEAIPTDDKTTVVHIPTIQKYKKSNAYNLVLKLYTGTPNPTVIEKIYDVPGYGYSNIAHIKEKKKSFESTRTKNFEILGGENN